MKTLQFVGSIVFSLLVLNSCSSSSQTASTSQTSTSSAAGHFEAKISAGYGDKPIRLERGRTVQVNSSDRYTFVFSNSGDPISQFQITVSGTAIEQDLIDEISMDVTIGGVMITDQGFDKSASGYTTSINRLGVSVPKNGEVTMTLYFHTKKEGNGQLKIEATSGPSSTAIFTNQITVLAPGTEEKEEQAQSAASGTTSVDATSTTTTTETTTTTSTSSSSPNDSTSTTTP